MTALRAVVAVVASLLATLAAAEERVSFPSSTALAMRRSC